MPRFEFRDENGFVYVTFTPNYEIALRNARINGFSEAQLVRDKQSEDKPHE